MSTPVMPHLRAFLSAALSLSMSARDKNPEKLGKVLYYICTPYQTVISATVSLFFKIYVQQ